ncbi:F-box/kelch-repeat protein At3g23880-like [Rutidosis leptorrhynchoides]|uniref:F-box/kelch-repeat protein At3g23880-like n=1 Tax=Rutidosis leptorrhynchoides TaxID=125765 RepID=UPI003A9A2487
MTSEVVVDVLEQILVRLDVKDLIRFKSVCKSWHSLISSDRFINYHLNCSYNNDLNNYAIGHRRIVIPSSHTPMMIGSSNGLVCISKQSDGQLLVANPLTRVVKKLQQLPKLFFKMSECWGFGYDSSVNDYKVILGFPIVKTTTCFFMLSLKTNIWQLIRDVNYEPISMSMRGVFLDGSVYWLMINRINSKKVILSFELSREEFVQISIPNECDQDPDVRLGVIKQCLCIYRPLAYNRKPEMKWVLEKCNAKTLWKRVPNDYGIKCDIIHKLKLEDRTSTQDDNNKISIHSGLQYLCISGYYVGDPIFVQSLVSPHVR